MTVVEQCKIPVCCMVAMLGIALSGGAASPVADGALVMAASPNTPPYCWRDESTGEVKGIDVEIAKAAAERLGRSLKVETMEFDDLLPAVRDGRADMGGCGALTSPSPTPPMAARSCIASATRRRP